MTDTPELPPTDSPALPEDGFIWMTHPSRFGGKPIPVRTFFEDGTRYYVPFDDNATDFEWDERDGEWKIVAAPLASRATRLAAVPQTERADETPAEEALRSLACWLGVGGYNAPTVDAKLYEQKIREGVTVYSQLHGIAARDLAETVLHMDLITPKGIRARWLARQVLNIVPLPPAPDAAPAASSPTPQPQEVGWVLVESAGNEYGVTAKPYLGTELLDLPPGRHPLFIGAAPAASSPSLPAPGNLGDPGMPTESDVDQAFHDATEAVELTEEHASIAREWFSVGALEFAARYRAASSPEASPPRGECVKTGDACARCGHDEVIAGPAAALASAPAGAGEGAKLATAWRDAYLAFKGAFDAPLCRRQHASEYANDARRRLRDFDEQFSALAGEPAVATPIEGSHPPTRHCMCTECRPSFDDNASAGAADEGRDAQEAKRWRFWRENRDTSLIVSMFGNGCVNRTIADVEQATDTAIAGQAASQDEQQEKHG